MSRYNHAVTDRLLAGALDRLGQAGFPDDLIAVCRVPGAWEIPDAARRLAATGQFDALICLGAVIRGETTHDEHINRRVSLHLGEVAQRYGVAVSFGVLTCRTLDQALQRAGGSVGNKGTEAAEAALEMVGLQRALNARFSPKTAQPE